MDSQHLTLQSGDKMPIVGFGMWKIAKDQCAQVTFDAIKAGYRCIDQACDYGNEKETGEGIKKAIDEGVIKRDDLWITSKLWNTYHRKEHVEAACKRSLADLGVDQLDLYMIHFPISLKFVPFEERYPPEWVHDPKSSDPRMEYDPVSIEETWRAMEQLVKDGLVKNIGICNFNASLLRDLLSYAEIKPQVLQVELHPFNSQKNLIKYAANNNIKVTGFSSFGASSYLEMGMATENEVVFNTDAVKAAAAAHGKSAAQITLRWAV